MQFVVFIVVIAALSLFTLPLKESLMFSFFVLGVFTFGQILIGIPIALIYGLIKKQPSITDSDYGEKLRKWTDTAEFLTKRVLEITVIAVSIRLQFFLIVPALVGIFLWKKMEKAGQRLYEDNLSKQRYFKK